jgi:hypothetical protein
MPSPVNMIPPRMMMRMESQVKVRWASKNAMPTISIAANDMKTTTSCHNARDINHSILVMGVVDSLRNIPVAK